MSDMEILLGVLDSHTRTIREEMREMKEISENRHAEILASLAKAFPDGDFASHYRYHMSLIEAEATRKALRLEIMKKVISGSVWGIIGFIGLKLIKWISEHVK